MPFFSFEHFTDTSPSLVVSLIVVSSSFSDE